MRAKLLVFLFSCLLVWPTTVQGQIHLKMDDFLPEVREFLNWYMEDESRVILRRVRNDVLVPAIAEAARMRAMFHATECRDALAEEFLDIAAYFDPENEAIYQTRLEKQAYLEKRSQEIQREAYREEVHAMALATRFGNATSMPLQAILTVNDSRLLYEQAYQCDQKNMAALAGYERMAQKQYGERYQPGGLARKSGPP